MSTSKNGKSLDLNCEVTSGKKLGKNSFFLALSQKLNVRH
jgi:hypothetical protein